MQTKQQLLGEKWTLRELVAHKTVVRCVESKRKKKITKVDKNPMSELKAK